MLIEITYNVTDVYMSTTETPVYVEISFEQPGGSAAVWGAITGTLSDQTDLQNALNLKVPYTGATTNVNLGEYELKAGQVTLDTSPTGTAAVGTTRWNDTTGTSETTLKGGNVIIKNGVDLVARVVNKVSPNTTLTKAAYQAVRVSGAQGQRLAVALAQANNDANSADTIGLVTETIATNQEGFIMTVGQLEGINTTGSLQGETWADGDVLYLSPTTAGAITNVQPTGSGHIVVIGYVEYAHANNGKIYVKVLNGWELTELHDTEIVNPLNNEGLFYETSSSLWKNKSISTVLGYTPEQPLTFNSPLSRAGNVVSIPQATGSVNGFLSATDWTMFNSKQAALGYTPANAATTLTINGVTFDLSANRSWTIAAGISGSGAAGQVTYWTGASAVSGSNNLFWDNANSRLGIGTNAPDKRLHIKGDNTSSDIVFETNTYTTKGYFAHYQGATLQLSINRRIDGVFSNTGAACSSIDLVALNNSSFISFYSTNTNNTTGVERMRIWGSGNVRIGGTISSDLGYSLGVVGDTLLRGSGATSATTALTVQNSSSTNLFTVRNDGLVTITNTLLSSLSVTSSNYTTRILINNTFATPNAGFELQTNGVTNWALANYKPTATTNASFVFYNQRTSTDSFFIDGDTNNVGIRTNAPTARLDIPASVTTAASLRIRSGTAPTTPNDGDIWFDGTDIKMRIGGVTKTFTLI